MLYFNSHVYSSEELLISNKSILIYQIVKYFIKEDDDLGGYSSRDDRIGN